MPRKHRAQLATKLFDELDRRCNANADSVGTISLPEVAFLRQAYAEAMTRDNSVSLVSQPPIGIYGTDLPLRRGLLRPPSLPLFESLSSPTPSPPPRHHSTSSDTSRSLPAGESGKRPSVRPHQGDADRNLDFNRGDLRRYVGWFIEGRIGVGAWGVGARGDRLRPTPTDPELQQIRAACSSSRGRWRKKRSRRRWGKMVRS